MTNKQKGAISQTLIVIAVVLLILIVVIFSVVRFTAKKQAPVDKHETKNEIPEPEYETTLGETRFIFVSAKNLGGALNAPDGTFQRDLITTEKFIRITVAAQNKGKNNLDSYSWDIGNVVDSDGRNFVPVNQAYYFLPQPNLCGELLKPEFEPTPCVKIYEVSKASTNLKITLTATGSTGKKQASLIDILVQ